MAQYSRIIEPTVPEVTWENLIQTCLLVIENRLNFYLELQKGKYGLKPIYEPRGHVKRGVPLQVWWFPKFIAEGFVERYKANTPSIDPNWPDELAAEVYRECMPDIDHLGRQEAARAEQVLLGGNFWWRVGWSYKRIRQHLNHSCLRSALWRFLLWQSSRRCG